MINNPACVNMKPSTGCFFVAVMCMLIVAAVILADCVPVEGATMSQLSSTLHRLMSQWAATNSPIHLGQAATNAANQLE